jgi:hypothetical protein
MIGGKGKVDTLKKQAARNFPCSATCEAEDPCRAKVLANLVRKWRPLNLATGPLYHFFDVHGLQTASAADGARPMGLFQVRMVHRVCILHHTQPRGARKHHHPVLFHWSQAVTGGWPILPLS